MNSITSIPTTITPKIIATVTTPRHQPPEFQRRHSCPVRSSSYDRGLFKREMYLKAYTIPPTSSPLSGDDVSTLISYTGLSSPRLAPIETNVPLDSPPADISDFTFSDLSPSLLDTSRRYKSHPQRRLSYDRNLYNKIMFTKAYNTPSSSLSPSFNNNHLSYTGLSSPKLLPIELNNNNHNNANNNNTNNTNNNYNGHLYITSTNPTTTSSSNRPSSPFSSKKITDDFLFRDNWPQEVIR